MTIEASRAQSSANTQPSEATETTEAAFSPDIEQADPQNVEFKVDARTTQITDQTTEGSRTDYSATAEASATAGSTTDKFQLTYTANVPATTAQSQMSDLNPFDPASIPNGSTIKLNGSDYVGTPLEQSFRSLAGANGLESIDDLRLQIETSSKGEFRVMTGPQSVFDAPKEHGPASLPSNREDFTTHTTLYDDGKTQQAKSDYAAMLVSGTLPPSTVKVSEDVTGNKIEGEVTNIGTGETNKLTWTLDNEGRPTHAEGTLSWLPSSRGRDTDRIETGAQSGFRVDNDMKGSGDDVGHIFAYRFVQGHGSVNMFPQESSFNQGPYAKMEQEWADWLDAGMDVKVSVTLSPQDVQRPDEVRVDYEVIDSETGKAIYDPTVIVYSNEAGQKFTPIAKGDMGDIIETA